MGGNIVEGVKKTVSGVKKLIKTVGNLGKFFATTIGQVVGILILVVFFILVIYVLSETIQNAIGRWFDDDYAGIATTEDYETIIGSISYAGYDSFVSEEKWQEYAAFEYAVLMDVAEHMYEYQDYVVEKEVNGKKEETSAVIPEGIVKTQYDADDVTDGWWKDAVVAAQGGNEPNIPNENNKEILGGNRKVVKPRLIYETASHEYEDDAVSLMPYLVVVREDIKLNYYLQGLDKGTWENYKNGVEIKPNDLESASSNLEAVKYSSELNRFNTNLPNSAYKDDLEEDIKRNSNGTLEDLNVRGVEDKKTFIKSDRDDIGYGSEIYYTEQGTNIVYKIPLKLLINRYLPKSSLLTTWYMLKKDDESGNGFKIDDLMDEIKGIYNAACYKEGMSEIEGVTTKGYYDENGNLKRESVTLRTPVEKLKDDTMKNAVIYDENGAREKDENGNVKLGPKDITYATTNYRTFIYFEQYGLETSRYEKYKAYHTPNADEANPSEKTAVATYLTYDRVNFVEKLNLTLHGVTYVDPLGITHSNANIDVSLKPTYTFAEEEKASKEKNVSHVDLEEKLKSKYLAKKNGYTTNAEVLQDKPYDFMEQVVKRAEEIMINKGLNIEISAKNTSGEYIYNHKFINEYYIRAEVGNENEKVSPENQKYKLPEDFRYYNQNDVEMDNWYDKMPHWYDIKGLNEKKSDINAQAEIEQAYLDAFNEIYKNEAYYNDIFNMIKAEYPEYVIQRFDGSYGVTYLLNNNKEVGSATLYNGTNHSNLDNALNGNYKINYSWDAVYTIEEKELQMVQTIHHRRMPVVLVKYCDLWAKSVEYDNVIIQNPLNYRNYKYLIPNSISSLGLASMELNEKASYRVETFKPYFNKANSESSKGKVSGDTKTYSGDGLKEGDILEMLIQWEEHANKGGDEVAYAYMRELYKLAIAIRDYGNTMLKSSYNYLYIPSTISNYKDSTVQEIFWLERLGVTQGVDELTEEEQKKTRTKAIDTKWQNLEYDEYYECVYDVGDGEDANVYALFPFGAPVIRSYYMLRNWDTFIINDFDNPGHGAVDIYSRDLIKNDILNVKENDSASSDAAKLIYYYELNRLTTAYMNNGNRKEDAFILAEKELNSMLEEYSKNSPIVAIAPGYVQDVSYNARSGFRVQISHNSGDSSSPQITSVYAHLKRWPLVSEGEIVGAGTILGYEGTTGRSTGNHLHLEIRVNGVAVDPKTHILPVFSPFYYDIKAEAVLKENTEKALGSEYYTLERTILPEVRLYNENNVIKGMKLSNGKVIDYTIQTNGEAPYKSGENYGLLLNESGNSTPYNLIWGNNVPDEPIATSLDGIIDLNLLNQSVGYKPLASDNGSGDKLSYDKDVTAYPAFFTANKEDYDTKYENIILINNTFDEKGEHTRLKWPKKFAVEMAEYKSELVVPCYNGPLSRNAEISSEEAQNDLKALQDSLKKAGYYQKAGVIFEEAMYGTYSELFEKVVIAMKKDLVAKGYGIYGIDANNGNLDRNTLSAYNTMLQYTTEENQFAMSEKTAYNAAVDLSIEPALEWAILCVEGEYGDKYLALKESKNTVESKSLKYNSYTKTFNRAQGLMQIKPKLAIEKYAEDKVKPTDAVLFIRQPLRNTRVGMETLKEYMIYFAENFKAEIDSAKNIPTGYWNTDVCIPAKKYETRWCDAENVDRLMIYALALEAYDKEIDLKENDKEQIKSIIDVSGILNSGPNEYSEKVLEKFREYIIDAKK